MKQFLPHLFLSFAFLLLIAACGAGPQSGAIPGASPSDVTNGPSEPASTSPIGASFPGANIPAPQPPALKIYQGG